MNTLVKPTPPAGVKREDLPQEFRDYLFELEEYLEKINLQKCYYKKLATMLCTEIEEGGFCTPTRREDARAVRELGIGV